MRNTSQKLHLVTNARSGKGAGGTLPELAQKICDEMGVELQVHKEAADAIAFAEKEGGVVVVAGGDGTVRSVAERAAGRKVSFAVVPCGTFNFFARSHRIPEDAEAALRLAITGRASPVRLGKMNDHIFLINASLGLYAKSIIDREHRTAKFGRNRIVVILSTLVSFFSRHRVLDVTFVSEQKTQRFETPMVFIGNNALQLRNLDVPVVSCLSRDLLALLVMKPVKKRDIFRILLRGIFKLLERENRLQSFCVEAVRVYSQQKSHTVALDGEIFTLRSPLEIQSLPDALNLVHEPEAAVPPEGPIPGH